MWSSTTLERALGASATGIAWPKWPSVAGMFDWGDTGIKSYPKSTWNMIVF